MTPGSNEWWQKEVEKLIRIHDQRRSYMGLRHGLRHLVKDTTPERKKP